MPHFPARQDLRFQCLVYTAEYDVKTVVWTRSVLSAFRDPEVFENAVVSTGPETSQVHTNFCALGADFVQLFRFMQ